MLMNSDADFSSISKSLLCSDEPRTCCPEALQHLVAMTTEHVVLSAELKVNLILLLNVFYS